MENRRFEKMIFVFLKRITLVHHKHQVAERVRACKELPHSIIVNAKLIIYKMQNSSLCKNCKIHVVYCRVFFRCVCSVSNEFRALS